MNLDTRDPKAQIENFKKRRIIIVRDDVSGIDRSILAAPAAGIDYEAVNLFCSFSGGLVYAALSNERISKFQLDSMSERSALGTNRELDMCVSVEAREGITTGISASDRMITLQVLGDDEPLPRKLVKPGHVFPVRTKDGGSIVRPGLAEAALDLVKFCNTTDAAAFVDILDSNGAFLENSQLQKFAEEHNLDIIPISSIIRHRLENEILVERVSEAKLPSKVAGEVIARAYKDKIYGSEHIAVICGDIDSEKVIPIRVQRENLVQDLFGGIPSSRHSLQKALRYMGTTGLGAFVYISRPGSPVSTSQTTPVDSQNAQTNMMREYGIGAQILRDLGVRKARLLTHSTKNLIGLKSFGIEIVSQEPIPDTTDNTKCELKDEARS